MNALPIELSEAAIQDLVQIHKYIFEQSMDNNIADGFIDNIQSRCASIANAPFGGIARPDLGRDLRMVPYKKNTIIIYRAEETRILIVNIFYGGRDYEALMQ